MEIDIHGGNDVIQDCLYENSDFDDTIYEMLDSFKTDYSMEDELNRMKKLELLIDEMFDD